MVCEHQTELIESFNAWSERRAAGEPLWPSFDRWVRDALNHCLQARRVRCFHTPEAGNRLVSLATELEEPLWPPSALPDLVVQVVLSGSSYLHGDEIHDDAVNLQVKEWTAAVRQTAGLKSGVPHWLLPIRAHNRTVGLVWVNELPGTALRDRPGLALVGALLTAFWREVSQAQALAVAKHTDPPSGVLTRTDLTARAELVLADSVRESEPVMVLALAVEGIRRLNDAGHWELRDHLMQKIGALMQHKLRSDDLVGRFSEDLFVAILRRLDPMLGQMVARKLLSAADALIREQPVLQEAVRIRCGLSDSGNEPLQAAVGRALEGLRLARLKDDEMPVMVPKGRADARLATGVIL